MTQSAPLRLIAVLLALGLLAISVWPMASGIKKVLGVNQEILSLQDQSNDRVSVRPSLWLIQANSHGAAGAALQARLRASARNADLSLTRVEVQPADAIQTELVRATAQANGDVRTIAKFLHLLESQTPVLQIERARISREDDGGLSLDLVILARSPNQGAS